GALFAAFQTRSIEFPTIGRANHVVKTIVRPPTARLCSRGNSPVLPARTRWASLLRFFTRTRSHGELCRSGRGVTTMSAPTLLSFFPKPEDALALTPEDFGGVIIELMPPLLQNGMFNPAALLEQAYQLTGPSYPPGTKKRGRACCGRS